MKRKTKKKVSKVEKKLSPREFIFNGETHKAYGVEHPELLQEVLDLAEKLSNYERALLKTYVS